MCIIEGQVVNYLVWSDKSLKIRCTNCSMVVCLFELKLFNKNKNRTVVKNTMRYANINERIKNESLLNSAQAYSLMKLN